MWIHKYETTRYTLSERATAATYAYTYGTLPEAGQPWLAVDQLVAEGGAAEQYLAGPRPSLGEGQEHLFRQWMRGHITVDDAAIREREHEQRGFEPFRAEAVQVRRRWLRRGDLPRSYQLIDADASRFVADFPGDEGERHTLTAYLPSLEPYAQRVDAHFLPFTIARAAELNGVEQGEGIAYEGFAVAKTPDGELTSKLSIEQIQAIDYADIELALQFLDECATHRLALTGLSRAYRPTEPEALVPFTFANLRFQGGLKPFSNAPRFAQLIEAMGSKNGAASAQDRERAIQDVTAKLIEVRSQRPAPDPA